MLLPPKFEDLLAKSGSNRLIVDQPLKLLEPILQSNALTFFPDYTDHGIHHIESVCATAEALITEDGWSAFTDVDAAVFVFSALLHDLAMHITEDQFVELVTDKDRPLIEDTGDQPWPLLWHRFLVEARRYDGRKLNELFGSPEPVRDPPLHPMEMTRKDRLLIGEFLRKHHARLAHEYALFGMSGGVGTIAFDAIAYEIRDLAGLIARSHNEPLRAMLPYLLKKYDIREFQRVHPVYLGALLRIGDYLQLEARRAPQEVLKIKRLRSPISTREFAVHHAVRDIRATHDDPESIFVDAIPGDVKTFVRLRDVLSDLQKELDTTWATLGEVYGRVKSLNPLQLSIRRVRSSLDDLDRLKTSLAFIPVDAKFRTADSDVLKLLVAPLYGNKPEIGVRELLQNSLDAVRELEALRSSGVPNLPEPVPHDKPEISIDVVDSPEECYVLVKDHGIGMNLDIVLNYFLSAGASYRQSSAWADLFNDKSGKSKVERSGRFGVGVLAAYLIGDRIEVKTRRFDEPEEKGIKFLASIEDNQLELSYTTTPVGTSIKVFASRAVVKRLSGERKPNGEVVQLSWFVLKQPLVVYTSVSNKRRVHIKQTLEWPLPNSTDLQGWTLLHPDGFEAVMWKYESGSILTCNGILIERNGRGWGGYAGELRRPSVAVFDRDGLLPLDLQRTKLSSPDFPFSDDLKSSIAKDFVQHVSDSAPEAPANDPIALRWFWEADYQGMKQDYRAEHLPFFWLKNGVGYFEPEVVRQACIERAIVVWLDINADRAIYSNIGDGDGLFFSNSNDSMTTVIASIRGFIEQPSDRQMYGLKNKVHCFKASGHRLVLSEKRFKEYEILQRLPKFLGKLMQVENSNKGYVTMSFGTCPNASSTFNSVLEGWSASGLKAGGFLLGEAFLDRGNPMAGESTQVAQEWLRRFGAQGMPYQKSKRLMS